MASYQKYIAMGNLTRDPELKYSQSGNAYCSFGMAINEKRGGEDKTCFIDVTAFSKSAETISQYLSKGDPLLIEGRLDFQQWESDGQRRSKLSVICDRFQMLGSGQRRDNNNSYTEPTGQREPVGAGAAEEPPF